MSSNVANVELLTAEVRTLQVGNRQVTLSVYRQLDEVPHEKMAPFGRVNDGRDSKPGGIYVVGRAHESGELVRSLVPKPKGLTLKVRSEDVEPVQWQIETNGVGWEEHVTVIENYVVKTVRRGKTSVTTFEPTEAGAMSQEEALEEYFRWSNRNWQHLETYWSWGSLPLIVLAGLR